MLFFRYANVELWVDDELVEKKDDSHQLLRMDLKGVQFNLGYEAGYGGFHADAKDFGLKIGSKIKLVWKGEPIRHNFGTQLTPATHPAEVARVDIMYRFLGG